jgi:Right handed beta helix region
MLTARGADFVGKPLTIVVGPGGPVATVAQAARLAHSGDTIEVEAGDYVGDVASWSQDDLTVRAVGGRVRIIAHGNDAESKAIWVIKGTRVVVEGIEFTGAGVTDLNGAGIRHEGGKLTVRNCVFDGNQMGLMTWNDNHAELVVERSEFHHNRVASTYKDGDPVGHQIYVGSIGRFTLIDSYVHAGAHGHLVKSRARENRIVNNRLTDEAGTASYELEFPNGGVAFVLGNVIEQSAHSENWDIVSYGAEGYAWPRNELYLVNNTLVSGLSKVGNFIHVRPGPDAVSVFNNLLVGDGRFHVEPSWKAAGNVHAAAGDVPLAATYDYRLSKDSALVGKGVDPGLVKGERLRPDREYVHPMQSRALTSPNFSPGALQSVIP